jgi:hypothetical protein
MHRGYWSFLFIGYPLAAGRWSFLGSRGFGGLGLRRSGHLRVARFLPKGEHSTSRGRTGRVEFPVGVGEGEVGRGAYVRCLDSSFKALLIGLTLFLVSGGLPGHVG